MSGLVHEASVGATVEWYTPAWVFDALGLDFDLDPCHPRPRLPWTPAREVYSLPDDGLALPWFGRVWCNPPYGKETVRWLRRLAEHGDGVALVFARTDPDWFHEVAARADAVLFVRGRVRFVGADGKPPLGKDGKPGTPGAGSMLLAWGEDNVRALERSGLGTMMWRAF